MTDFHGGASWEAIAATHGGGVAQIPTVWLVDDDKTKSTGLEDAGDTHEDPPWTTEHTPPEVPPEPEGSEEDAVVAAEAIDAAEDDD